MLIDVSTELAVMQSVGNALAQLPDARSRARVLRWAATQVRSAEEGAAVGELATGPAADPIVSIEGLVADLFPDLGAGVRQDLDGLEFGTVCGDDLAEGGESLDTLIRGLSEELGQFAIDWQRA
jgi:hypothetical protein